MTGTVKKCMVESESYFYGLHRVTSRYRFCRRVYITRKSRYTPVVCQGLAANTIDCVSRNKTCRFARSGFTQLKSFESSDLRQSLSHFDIWSDLIA